jgi:tetraacyldisaccharide 4'-kinase
MIALERAWYGPRQKLMFLWPLHCVMSALVAFRRFAYRAGWFKSVRINVPVIVIGNITVGGTGKTPLTVFVIQQLQQWGFSPGIISRGYGGKSAHYPLWVTHTTLAQECGDEPLLLARQTGVPLVVDPNRVRAAQTLREQGCNIIVSDDGLQHYRLQRDIEIAVIDAVRQVGNGWLIPAGPLREPLSRLTQVDLRVGNGASIPILGEHAMQLHMSVIKSLEGQHEQTLSSWQGKRVHAVAGIGNPERFFAQLEQCGLQVERHALADHHHYQTSDFKWTDAPVVMTEKDAVKCQGFELENLWYVPVQAQLSAKFVAALKAKMQKIGTVIPAKAGI